MERIRLENTVFEGRNNAYLFTNDPITVVDTGVAVDATREQLEAGLEDHGVAFGDIERVFLTHYHADHSGLAAAIHEAGDATIYIHEADAPLVRRDPDSWKSLRDTMETYFAAWGMPDRQRDALRSFLDGGASLYGPAVPVESISEGDRFPLADTTLRVLHAPGHTAGLCVFKIQNEVLTGDALLPVYTPNVGGADVRVDRPLERYLHTLNRLANYEFDVAWPGHREPMQDPTERANETIRHHEERAYRVLQVLDDQGPLDAWEVSAELFGDLVEIHILHGPGEAYAHLAHLVETGDVIQVASKYQITPDAKAKFDSLPDDYWPLLSHT